MSLFTVGGHIKVSLFTSLSQVLQSQVSAGNLTPDNRSISE